MADLLTWVARRAVKTAPKLAFQVTVSVVATFCAAFITNGYLQLKPHESPATPAPPMIADPKAAAELLKGNFTEEGVRLRPAHPLEFAAVYGLAPGQPYTPLKAADWSAAPQDIPVPLTPETKAEETSGSARTCLVTCAGRLVAMAVLPPPRPASLTQVAEAQPAAAITSDQETPVRLLGMSLPGFVPSGETIARTVVSWGSTVVGVIPGL
jgi:hypothetical protein